MVERASPADLWDASRKLVLTWLALCFLLAATCALAYVPMGKINLLASLVIAAIKASLVGAIFMRLSEDNAVNRLAALVGPIWIFIMFLLMGADYFTR
jgi:caa(3)-type oxidase subunit IV